MIKTSNQNRLALLLFKVFFVIGLVFFVPGIICLCVSLFVGNEEAALALRIIGFVFSFLGLVFATIGAIFRAIAIARSRKYERLVAGGLSYEAQIVKSYENVFTRINHIYPYIVECSFTDSHGKTYLVKSGNIWPDYTSVRASEIKARVWVNPANPKDYFVEVYGESEVSDIDKKYDFDYR